MRFVPVATKRLRRSGGPRSDSTRPASYAVVPRPRDEAMRNIFELTKGEQRTVIVIVTILVAIAFAKHFWQGKSPLGPMTSKSSPATTSSPGSSPDQLPDK